MTQALAKRDTPINLPQVYEGLGMMPPAVKVAIAADWAKSLMEVVEQKRLFQLIGGKKHLQAEAWELIGSFDDCTAETSYVCIVEDGEIVGYKGIAVLMRRGERVGGGEGACYLDASVTRGKQGRSRDRAAQSAAQTWAAAKALRIKYSYVAVLGGYEPTPAEEMHDDPPRTNTLSAAPPSATPNRQATIDNKRSVVPAAPTDDLTNAAFWPQAYDLIGRRDSKAVHDALDIGSLKEDWLSMGRTRREAIWVLRELTTGRPLADVIGELDGLDAAPDSADDADRPADTSS